MESVRRVPCPRANLMSDRWGPAARGVLEGICQEGFCYRNSCGYDGKRRIRLIGSLISRTYHAQIARHVFCFFDQGSETSPDAFSPERFAPWVEIKRSEQLNHVLR